MAKSKQNSPFSGRWRIVSMEQWGQDFVDEEEEGYFEFDDRGSGSFHFGYVHGNMDCDLTTRDGAPAVEWTWDGNDEMDAAHGRGWAVLADDELHGAIFFHHGESSKFVAKKPKTPKGKRGQKPDNSAKAFQELVRVLAEAVQFGVSSIGLERKGRDLIVFYQAGRRLRCESYCRRFAASGDRRTRQTSRPVTQVQGQDGNQPARQGVRGPRGAVRQLHATGLQSHAEGTQEEGR
jgi:hypothetical protein